MSLNVSYNQSASSIDSQALRAVTQEIFKRAESKSNASSTGNALNFKKNTLGMDFYNGRTDAATARQVAMTNTGLQIQANAKLMESVQFLNTQAAKSLHKTLEGRMTVDVNEMTTKTETKTELPKFNSIIRNTELGKDKQGSSNPFYQAETSAQKTEKKENKTINIFA